jgi:ligand-binding sensor domain-containing protein
MLRRARSAGSRLLALFLLAWGGTAPRAYAQEPERLPPSSARFQHFTVENGLSQNTVRAVVQDRTGFLWFATEEGLNRFDGYSFVPFRHKEGDPTSLPDDMLTSLHEDGAGQIWVGMQSGLGVFDTRTERARLRLATPKAVLAVLEDRQGAVWVATDGAGLYRLDKNATEPIRYRFSADDPTSLAHDSVYALLQDRAGRIWVGTNGGGLDLFDPVGNGFVHYRKDKKDAHALVDDRVWSLAEDKAGRIWVGTEGGVSVLVPDGGPSRVFHAKAGDARTLLKDMVTTVYVDRRGTVWLGTDGGLDRYVPEDDSFVGYKYSPDNPEGLTRNAVRAIFEDDQENLWVSTYASGVSLLRTKSHPFRYFTYQGGGKAGLSDYSVNAFLEDRDGGLWVGTGSGGLHRFDPAGRFTLVGSVDAPLVSLHQDDRGHIWIGTWDKGLHEYDPARRTFTSHAARVGDRGLWSIIGDGGGGLLIATTDAGIVHYDPASGSASHERHDPAREDSLGSDAVRALARDPAGNLWVGTYGGLDMKRADGGGYVHYRHDPRLPHSLSHDAVLSLHRDAQSRLWVGTLGGGLNLFDPATGTFTAVTTTEGLPSNLVAAILEDDQGRLWLSTHRGLCRFDPRDKRVESYDLTNGLQSLHFNHGTALRARTGMMLFGSENGFYLFDPARIQPNPQVPPIVLTSFKVLNEPRKTDVGWSHAEEIRLRYDEKIFSLEFAVLDYTFPRRNDYAYRLEGFDHDWIDVGARREITFTNLDPGRYVLHVKGSNSDAVWAEGRALRIVITPPYWATWWFRLTAAALAFGVLLGAHRWRLAVVEARERELQLRVDEAMSRVKILKGLLPICATCKKVRDDKGYWNQIEQYISDHSEADFSHGICPDCIAKYYPRHRGGQS